MKWLKPIFGILTLVGIVIVGNSRIGALPPVFKFIDPFKGFWQNAELPSDTITFPELPLDDEANVVLDDRGVPHVFASTERDLYFLQGYLTAKDRLWQMEFQTHAAAGRISEIVGKKALAFDREQRTIGMTYAADNAMKLIERDSLSMKILQAYAEGVNAYIGQLDERSKPLEYKLLDYEPEPWTIFKSALLLKYMAKMLTGTERDLAHTEALKLFGDELFWKLYPDQTYLSDPIVPGFNSKASDSIVQIGSMPNRDETWHSHEVQPHFVGSNNWAVSGKRTESGNAILCNDPHLRLSLPSIWYEIQLHAPGINCYGVSLPGSPGITIGFNENVAWGVTNSGRDVKDYYSLDLNNGTYKVGDKEFTVEQRLEQINVRDQQPVMDTVLYTVYGPIVQHSSTDNSSVALRWLAHDASNELMTFYELNRASNFDDYANALDDYQCPGQNFAYADGHGDIAIWQQGKFKIKPKGYGKVVLDGSLDQHLSEQFIPKEHNPHMRNPERGFVSSANQAAVDSSYPYYVSGTYEEFRNRTINRFLRADSSVSVQDMKQLQLSNYNLLAEEALPLMLALLDTSRFENDYFEDLAYQLLTTWNYSNDRGIISPTVFEIWWDELNALVWDELNDEKWDQSEYYRYSWEKMATDGIAKLDMRDSRFVYPSNKILIDLLRDSVNHRLFDHRFTTDKIENAQDLIYDSFYWTVMKLGDIMKFNFNRPHWGHYQKTKVRHLLRLEAFDSPNLFVGGSEHAPNATTGTHGPSWRMIVEMDKNGPVGYGVLPGGQSGNPGSKNYLYSLKNWVYGDYHRLHLLQSADALPGWKKVALKIKKQ